MIKISNITIKDFLSVGRATQAVRLDQHGLTLILGANTDSTGGVTRNGAGKTTILQAVSFALYGKPLTKIKADNLVNNINNKAMMVSIEFEKDGTTYRIERGRKPQVLRFYVGGQEQKEETDDAQGENRHTQEEIERVLGMSHTMFSHVLALNTFTDPFLKMKVADQRAVIEELLGVTLLSSRAETLKKLITQTKDSVRDEEASIKAVRDANARLEEMIDKGIASARSWQKNHDADMAEIVESIAQVERIDFAAEITAFDALDAWSAKAAELNTALKMGGAELQRVRTERDGHTKDAQRYEREKAALDPEAAVRRFEAEAARKRDDAQRHDLQASKLDEEMKALRHDIEHADGAECRCCGQPLHGTDHLETVKANLQRQLANHEKKHARETKEAAARRAEADEIALEVEGVRADAENDRLRLDAKITAAMDRAAALAGTVQAFEEAVATATHDLTALGARPQTTFTSRDEVYRAKQMFETLERDLHNLSLQTNPYTDQVQQLRDAVQDISLERVNELQDIQKHQELLHKLLTNKDSFIRKKIIDQNLSYLNSRLSIYLEKLGLPHSVTFQPDLSVDISYLGRDFDFEQLSRGEMNRVIMATSWSFRDVWESLNESVNLYFIDEVLDQGTDSQGAEAALGILKGMARDRGKNVFLISHRDELVGRIDRTLLVRKDNGFSRFEEDVV